MLPNLKKECPSSLSIATLLSSFNFFTGTEPISVDCGPTVAQKISSLTSDSIKYYNLEGTSGQMKEASHSPQASISHTGICNQQSDVEVLQDDL